MQNGKTVFRQFVLPVSTFDFMKDYQRQYELKHQVQLTNNDLIVLMLAELKNMINVESEEHNGRARANPQ